MEAIHVHGGVSLQGSVRIHGSKNAALPIRLAASNVTRLTNQESGVLDTIEHYFDFSH